MGYPLVGYPLPSSGIPSHKITSCGRISYGIISPSINLHEVASWAKTVCRMISCGLISYLPWDNLS